MPVQLPVTDNVVEAYLKCPHKAYLRLTGVTGQPSEYVALQRTLDDQYRADARAAWLRRRPLATVAADPPSIAAARGSQVITGLTLGDAGETCRFDALERIDGASGTAHRHSPECEYRDRCRAAAVARDDLSLLQALTPQDVEQQNKRGIFTVAQLSHAFRPRRFRMLAQKGSRRHDPALQALAVRDDKVYVA